MDKVLIPQAVVNWLEILPPEGEITDLIKTKCLPQSVKTLLEICGSTKRLEDARNFGYVIDEGKSSGISTMTESEDDMMVNNIYVGDDNFRIIPAWSEPEQVPFIDDWFTAVAKEGRVLVVDTNYLIDKLMFVDVDVNFVLYDLRNYKE